MTPFHRFALLLGTTMYAVGLAFLWRYFGWVSTLAVALAGAVVALLVTLEFAPRSPAVRGTEAGDAAGEPGANGQEFTIRQRDRKDIERSAQRARDE